MLKNLLPDMINLNNMIGQNKIKNQVANLILYYSLHLNKKEDDLLHTIIDGEPGTGKTEFAQKIAKIYLKMGVLKKDIFKKVKRSDLIGKYLGHTAKMTQEVFDNAKGGILFIDEAYSLGNPEGRDSFSKECIDTINQNLTENKDVVVFIAGYKEQLDESFFSYNPGLNRRFKMRISVDKYSASELRDIYIKKIKDDKWEIMENDDIKNIPLKFFEKNYEMFKYNGGDMENLWHLTKISHARRIFGKEHFHMKKIVASDLEKAFNNYLNNDEFKNRKDDIKKYLQNTMYM
jgi:SpoVK/Ycf46/Vps4 family AAA+-type ATPase